MGRVLPLRAPYEVPGKAFGKDIQRVRALGALRGAGKEQADGGNGRGLRDPQADAGAEKEPVQVFLCRGKVPGFLFRRELSEERGHVLAEEAGKGRARDAAQSLQQKLFARLLGRLPGEVFFQLRKMPGKAPAELLQHVQKEQLLRFVKPVEGALEKDPEKENKEEKKEEVVAKPQFTGLKEEGENFVELNKNEDVRIIKLILFSFINIAIS